MRTLKLTIFYILICGNLANSATSFGSRYSLEDKINNYETRLYSIVLKLEKAKEKRNQRLINHYRIKLSQILNALHDLEVTPIRERNFL